MEDFKEDVEGKTTDGGEDRLAIFQGFQDCTPMQLGLLKPALYQVRNRSSFAISSFIRAWWDSSNGCDPRKTCETKLSEPWVALSACNCGSGERELTNPQLLQVTHDIEV